MDETVEVFDTEGEAISFIEGLETATEMIDDDHLTWGKPELLDNRWQVTVSYAC